MDAADAPMPGEPTTRGEPVRPIEVCAAFAGVVVVFSTLEWPEAAFAAAWWLLVFVVMRSDLADFLIPDEASVGIALLGLGHAATIPMMAGQPLTDSLLALATALSQGIAAAAFLWAIGRTFRFVRGHEGLGFGDVKLAGASAVWLSLLQQSVTLQLAATAALGAVLFERQTGGQGRCGALPFGAFLAPAAWLVHVAYTLAPGLFEGPR